VQWRVVLCLEVLVIVVVLLALGVVHSSGRCLTHAQTLIRCRVQILKHFRETLPVFSNAIIRFPKRHSLPSQVVHLLSLQIDDVLFTRGARHWSKGLSGKHTVFHLVTLSIFCLHDEVVEVFDIFLDAKYLFPLQVLVGIPAVTRGEHLAQLLIYP